MARLLIRNEILEDQVLPIVGESCIVGRGRDAQIRIQDKTVSRFHARLESDGRRWLVTDLGSSNGTSVNGNRIQETTPIGDGDSVQFGSIATRFDVGPAKQAAVAPDPAQSPVATAAPLRPASALLRRVTGSGANGWVVGGLALIVVALCATATVKFLRQDDPASPTHRADAAPTPGSQPERPAPPEVVSTSEAPEVRAPVTPTPAATDPPPERPKPTPPEPPTQVLVLTDGARHTGHVVDNSDAIRLHFRTKGPGRRIMKVNRETIASLDGAPMPADLSAILEARLALAGSPEGLMEVARWCEAAGLKEDRAKVARMVVEGDRDHLEANAMLGRYKYRGEWSDRAKLEATGCISEDGRLIGTNEDIQEIRRLFLITAGRTPLRSEMIAALAEARAETATRLLDSPEHWRAWLAELLIRFLGPENGAVLLEKYKDLAEEMADGTLSFRDVFVQIAMSDSVRVQYPSPEAFARRILLVFIGEQALDDADLIRNAIRMVGGERVPVFGERGASREEFLEIIARQAQFYRWQIRYEAARYLGPDVKLSPRDLTRNAMRLAVSANNFKKMRRGWLLGPALTGESGSDRVKDVGQYVRSLIVDTLNRRPRPTEEGRLRRIAADLGEPQGMRSFLAALLAQSGDLHLDAPKAKPNAQWVGDQFRRLLGRGPTASERREFEAVASDPGGHRAVVAALLQSPEYLLY